MRLVKQGSGWSAWSEDLPVVMYGDTSEEAANKLFKAMHLYMKTVIEINPRPEDSFHSAFSHKTDIDP